MDRSRLLKTASLVVALSCVSALTAAVGRTTPAATSARAAPVSQIPDSQKLGQVTDAKTGSDGKATRVRVALSTQAGTGRVARPNN